LSYLCGASGADPVEKLKYDLFHVKNHNPLLDLLILTQTVEVFFFGRGARKQRAENRFCDRNARRV
jgi:lipopolysaccharide/colanic/teichoic acid biosynthesis glycosyltransferase